MQLTPRIPEPPNRYVVLWLVLIGALYVHGLMLWAVVAFMLPVVIVMHD